FRFETMGVTVPAIASSVAVASHSVPTGRYGMTSELGLRPVMVQCWMTLPLTSSPGWPRYWTSASAEADPAPASPIAAAAAAVMTAATVGLDFTCLPPVFVDRAARCSPQAK